MIRGGNSPWGIRSNWHRGVVSGIHYHKPGRKGKDYAMQRLVAAAPTQSIRASFGDIPSFRREPLA